MKKLICPRVRKNRITTALLGGLTVIALAAVSGGYDNFVCLWSLAEPRLRWRQRTQLDGAAAVAVSPDAQTIAAYSQASTNETAHGRSTIGDAESVGN